MTFVGDPRETPPTQPSFTAREKLDCAEREVRMRERVYRRNVELGRMKRETADREIGIMKSIATDYRAQMAREVAASPFGPLSGASS